MALMVTVSGVRGIIGESLYPAVIEKYTGSFAALLRSQINEDTQRTIVLGRDSRVTGEAVCSIVRGILMLSGFDVIDLGIVPTPTVQFAVTHRSAAGGVVVTSSHNPIQWNGLKFVDTDGLFLSPDKCKIVFANADSGDVSRGYVSYDKRGSLTYDEKEGSEHVKAILDLPYVQERVEKLKKRNFKVCLDAVNGAGGPVMTELLEGFGCTVVGLNVETNGLFAHTPEPIPENLGSLCESVIEHKCDFGVAVDPDVDRCVLINEKGECIGEEYTLAFALKFMLGCVGVREPVCKNLSSSRALDDIAAEYGVTVYPAPVGEINVAKEMLAKGSRIGGEGNGGVMLKDIHIGRDAPVAAALVLCLMSEYLEEGLSMSQVKDKLPIYDIAKHKAPLAGLDPKTAIASIRAEYVSVEGVELNDRDGLRIDAADWWIHLRTSNTEPILRVIGEAGRGQGKEASDALCVKFMEKIKSISVSVKK